MAEAGRPQAQAETADAEEAGYTSNAAERSTKQERLIAEARQARTQPQAAQDQVAAEVAEEDLALSSQILLRQTLARSQFQAAAEVR